MSATIVQAMIARFGQCGAASDCLASQSPWLNAVPEEVAKTLPFAVLTHEGADAIEFTTETQYTELHHFTWLILASGSTPLQTAESIALKVKQSFDNLADTTAASTALPLVSGKTLACRRTGYKVDVEGVDANGNAVYSVQLPYDVWILGTLGTS